LVAVAEDNLKEALLRGEAVPVEAMKPVTDMLASILPKAATSLNIRFVGVVDSCPKCGFEKECAPESAPPKANYSSPLPEAPAPQPAEPATAAPPVPSANIVALRKDIHACAPLARHDEPWRASIASEFRRFDIPENF
jgi:hypothetical protein